VKSFQQKINEVSIKYPWVYTEYVAFAWSSAQIFINDDRVSIIIST